MTQRDGGGRPLGSGRTVTVIHWLHSDGREKREYRVVQCWRNRIQKRFTPGVYYTVPVLVTVHTHMYLVRSELLRAIIQNPSFL